MVSEGMQIILYFFVYCTTVGSTMENTDQFYEIYQMMSDFMRFIKWEVPRCSACPLPVSYSHDCWREMLKPDGAASEKKYLDTAERVGIMDAKFEDSNLPLL